MPNLQVFTDARQAKLEIRREEIVEAEIATVARLPHGMTSGASSVSVYAKLREPLKLDDGRVITHIFCETSLACFTSATAVFLGAEQRDKANRKN